MSFTWPLALLMIGAIPLIVGLEYLQKRRRRKRAVRFSNVALVRAALGTNNRRRRMLPLMLFLAAIAALTIATARPTVSADVPVSRTSIVLALDVSRSMCATDVEPNRLAVAQAAARDFVENQPDGARIGIVAFAGSAQLIVPPTTDTDALLGAIDGLATARGTVIGAATLTAIDAIAAINPAVAPVDDAISAAATSRSPLGTSDSGTPTSQPEGDYVPDVVVLLTDGANTRGIDPISAAEIAAERRVRVFTIGFGTTTPTAMVCTREQLGAEALGDDGSGGGPPFGGGPGGGAGGAPRQFLVIDEPTLQSVADITGGTFYKAESADQLRKVFAELPSQIEVQTEKREIGAIFAAIGAALAFGAITLSLLWNRSG
ncbi:MAG: VWA domain-containing protein [Acidimicrobiia bacterium]